MMKPKIFFFITSSSLALFIYWLYFTTTSQLFVVNENVMKEAIQNFNDNPKEKSQNSLKYMLIWNHRDLAPLNQAFFKDGQASFIANKCSYTNCFITADRNFFQGDVTKFDAIAFNGRSAGKLHLDLPKERSPHQKYIFFNMESSDYIPMCNSAFDNFFNWTATYKLDSDIPFTYLIIKKDGKVIGPDINMNWEEVLPANKEYTKNFNKKKVAAWFVSNCSTRSKRENAVLNLQKALSIYNYTVDIYGACGPLKCSRSNEITCNKKLEQDYYFYLSFENAFAEDYVTEKLLRALQHDVVPIVLGGADYSRFLPPNSYLDVRDFGFGILSKMMYDMTTISSIYAEYFRWKPFYQYSNPQTTDNVCKLCAALNDKEKFNNKTVYKNFREWWSPTYKERCSEF